MPELPRLSRVCAMLIAAAAALSCSNPREDVRVTLCKDMVTLDLGVVPSWQGSQIQTQGREGAVVTVHFAGAGGDQQAACYYKYDAVEDTAVTLANPIEAYAASPSKMILNGRTLTGADLAQLVKRAMQKQGRAFLDRARETLRGQ